jgi:ketosteroid isomerase-like protein
VVVQADVEANKAVVNRFLHEPKGVVHTLSDDVCWTLVGTAPMCGTYRGKAEALQRLLRPLAAQFASPGSWVVDNIVAEGVHVVVQARGAGRVTKAGKAYDNTYCMVFRVEGGLITEIHEYCDTELITATLGTG